MEKTIKEWYEELPEPYRTQAITNCETQSPKGYDILNSFSQCKSRAIAQGFFWQTSPEGEEYWSEINLTLEADEFKENRREDWEWEVDQEDNANRTEFEN